MTKMCYLYIEYANPNDLSDSFTVRFKLRDNTLAPLWVDRVLVAQEKYAIDHPSRFYGFGTLDSQTNYALQEINNCIDVINYHKPLVERKLYNVDDSDTLNYLHHIFETYHGLLGLQQHQIYLEAPDHVKSALAYLNICVHRCESVSRGAKPRHVVTYFGLPKTKTLTSEHYNLFTDIYQFGTVYLNYVEIGKTLEDLTLDNDRYIGDDAFKPFNYYSADFCVMYFNSDLPKVLSKRTQIKNYFNQNSEFFLSKGYYPGDPRLNAGRIPLADIDNYGTDVLQLLEHRQYVKSVSFK